MCVGGKVLWVASAPSTLCTVEANYVCTCKCDYLRAFNKQCLLKHRSKFDLTI